VRTILPSWFDQQAESFSNKEVQIKYMQFCLPVKASCSSAEKVNETPTLAECTSPLENLHCTSTGLSDRAFLAHQKGL